MESILYGPRSLSSIYLCIAPYEKPLLNNGLLFQDGINAGDDQVLFTYVIEALACLVRVLRRRADLLESGQFAGTGADFYALGYTVESARVCPRYRRTET
jgi:hypothetical protein